MSLGQKIVQDSDKENLLQIILKRKKLKQNSIRHQDSSPQLIIAQSSKFIF